MLFAMGKTSPNTLPNSQELLLESGKERNSKEHQVYIVWEQKFATHIYFFTPQESLVKNTEFS